MRKLTKRERVLIYLAVILLVVYAGRVFLDLPVVVRYEESRADLLKVQDEWTELKIALEHSDEINQRYEEKKAGLKTQIGWYHDASTKTGLEKYVLFCLERAGLIPIRTLITRTDEKESKVHMGNIEVEAEGSFAGSTTVLDYLLENPILRVDTYSLYPEAGTENQIWKLTIRLEYKMSALWEEVWKLMTEDS